ncbi:MAG: glycosyltransferase [Acidobacteriia bacterium]|jgi:glycosyltransferase involved in cell wall biosynthesis|nr:glycosyltransferase [Terriglobia bacterium]
MTHRPRAPHSSGAEPLASHRRTAELLPHISSARAPAGTAAAAEAAADSTAETKITYVALLGRPDQPTDGVADYCAQLRAAMAEQGCELVLARVDWAGLGWSRALAQLRVQARDWRGCWVLVQYTMLAWSRRGFPLRFPGVVRTLQRAGARVAVLLHDPSAAGGDAPVQRLRRAVIRSALRRAARRADRVLVTVAPEKIDWLVAAPELLAKTTLVPVGSNVPARWPPASASDDSLATVCVFGVTEGHREEAGALARVVCAAAEKVGQLRLRVFGRGAQQAEPALREALAGAPVVLELHGLLPAEQIADLIASSHALLFVRGGVSSRRGSAIAGIACGVPVVAYASEETAPPMTEAGILLVPRGDETALASELARVLTDPGLREGLRQKHRVAWEAHFSWPAVARKIRQALNEITAAGQRRYRLLALATHPTQYGAPGYRWMTAHPRLELTVAYLSLRGAEAAHDPEFGRDVQWDVPLLEGYRWIHLGQYGRLRSLQRLWQLVRHGSWDAVAVYTGYRVAAFWVALAAAKRSRAAVLFGTDAHTLEPRVGGRWKVPVKRWLWPRLFCLADVVIVPSSGGVALMRALGIPEEKIALTPYAVDNAWWLAQSARADRAAVRAAWGVPLEAPVVVFSAKLQPWKRPADLLRAFAACGVESAHLVFAGEGPLRGALEAEARALGVAARTHFLGFVNQSQLPAVYTAADLLVLPSGYEPFGVVVNEAMLCGCGVVVSDRVGARFDLVREGETGFVFPAGDVDALAGILRRVLANRELLRRLGAAARERMRSWSLAENTDAVVAALDRHGNLAERRAQP